MTVHFGQSLDFYTIATSVDLTDADAFAYISQIIGLRAQPVLAGEPYRTGDEYVFRFAVQDRVWDAAPDLLETLIANDANGVYSPENTRVTKADRL